MEKKFVNESIVVENARLIFKNFSGEARRFNDEGDRNFCVVLDRLSEKEIDRLDLLGWGIRWLKPRDEDDEPVPYLRVSVAFNYRPPKIIMISGGRKVPITEDTVSMLDWADIENVDLVIRPYNWEAAGRTGVKGYLKTMYVTLIEDEFSSKYKDVPDES